MTKKPVPYKTRLEIHDRIKDEVMLSRNFNVLNSFTAKDGVELWTSSYLSQDEKDKIQSIASDFGIAIEIDDGRQPAQAWGNEPE